MDIVHGSYLGTGVARHITVPDGNRPFLVWIVSTGGIITWRSSAMPDDFAIDFNGNASGAGLITSFDATGFNIGINAQVNALNVTFYWIAFVDDNPNTIYPAASAIFAVGGYIGDGVDGRNITVGFQPGCVIVQRTALSGGAAVGRAVCGYSTLIQNLGADSSEVLTLNEGSVTNRLQGVGATTFQLGSDALTNQADAQFFYMAYALIAGFLRQGSHTGNGLDNRAIQVGFASEQFRPTFVTVKREGAGATLMAFRHPNLSGDNSWVWGSVTAADRIQALDTATFPGYSFEIGTTINTSLVGYHTHLFHTEASVPAPSSTVPFGGPAGAFFPLPTDPYGVYKSSLTIHERLTRARIV